MMHDGNLNDCGLPNGEPAKLMAPMTSLASNIFSWSRCSRKYITEFFE